MKIRSEKSKENIERENILGNSFTLHAARERERVRE
jgi:hypothetical protein